MRDTTGTTGDTGSSGLRIHPRHAITQRASLDVREALLRAVERHDLTYGEVFTILADALAEWAKHARRDERHPTARGKKADEA